MYLAIKRFCQGTPILRDFYYVTRKAYHRRLISKLAKDYFINVDDYREALHSDDDEGRVVDIRTRDGLTLTIRRNYMEATILAEVFMEKCYVRDFLLPDHPVVVDIGGFIGDFALYAAQSLKARRVVVYEPSPGNWTVLTKNVATNKFEDRIEMVNKAVTDGRPVMLNVDAPNRGQARVSAYGSINEARKLIPGVTLAQLLEDHQLSAIDLLKIDCEGGEYDILSTTGSEVFTRIRNIVFEYHPIDGFAAKLRAVKQRLTDEGYSLKAHGSLVSASREQLSSRLTCSAT